MNTVDVWTGREALMLRTALRLSQRGFAAYLGVSQRIVATWDQRGTTITPRNEIQAILDTALVKAPTEAQMRFQQALGENSDTLGPTSPRPAAEGLVWLAPPSANAVPSSQLSTLTLIDAQQIEMLAVELTAWDHARGGSLARIAAVAQAHWAAELLSTSAPTSVRTAVARASAQLCLAAGHMAFDAQRHEEALALFASALECSRVGKDPRLEAKSLSHQARQEIWCGEPGRALDLLDGALELPGLSGSERAMLHSGRARALAKLNQTRETLAAVVAADRAFAQHQPEDTPAWMTYYDEAQHQGDTGHALFDLAVQGREQTEALTRLHAAAEGHDREHARSQAFSRAKLAALQFSCGDADEALATAIPAARQIIALRSGRALASLSEVARYAYPFRTREAAAELSELVRTAGAR